MNASIGSLSRILRHGGLAVSLALLAGAAGAQQKSAVSDEDMARARKEIQEQMKKIDAASIESARQKHIAPQQNGSREEAINATRPQMPKVDALANPLTKPNVDIGALAKRLADNKTPGAPNLVTEIGPRLRVFITMAMPAESLKALVAQADAVGATLVLRGMVNDSLKETAAAVRKLRGKRKVAVSIDPEAFDRYGVTHAPAFVLTRAQTASDPKPCAGKTCEHPETYALVSGDVSIQYALEKLEQRAPQFKAEAQSFLKKIRG